MDRRPAKGGQINIVFPVMLFLIFTLSALFIILFSARTYQHIVDSSNNQYVKSVSSSYIFRKVHSSDRIYNVSIGENGDVPTLRMFENIDGQEFVTHIYVYDGYLRELFTQADKEISPTAGTALFPANDFKAYYLKTGVLKIEITMPTGEVAEEILTVRTMV